MVVIRPITLNDLDPLQDLTRLTGFGLTTLPCDAKLLRRRIRESLRGFEKLSDEDPPRGETYLFVLEDLATKKVVGTCGIVSKVGGFEPFYAYRVEKTIHQSAKLNIRKEISTLHLVEEHDGPCEIGSLFLSPDFRKDGNGRLLSQSRFLFMAEHLEYFDPVIIAEMRGVVDDKGNSPFWEALGRHFFDVDFPAADYLSMIDKKFIAELMPEHPIYVPLLPKEAQAVIGKVHEQTAPALRILEEEGFRTNGEVDIFEAGPVVRCLLNEIRTVRESVKEVVIEITNDSISGEPLHVSTSGQEFRACRTKLQITPAGVRLGAEAAEALRIKPGGAIRYATTRAARLSESEKHAAAIDAPGASDATLY